jgi:hypothetical protein
MTLHAANGRCHELSGAPIPYGRLHRSGVLNKKPSRLGRSLLKKADKIRANPAEIPNAYWQA